MASLTKHHSAESTKLLLMGDSGTGKTGALVPLVIAGYKLRVLDFDNGFDIVKNILSDIEAGVDNAMTRIYAPLVAGRKFRPGELTDLVDVEVLTEKWKQVGGKPIVNGMPQVFSKACTLLDHWKTPDGDLGRPDTWGKDTILALDSLTFLSKAALWYILFANSRLGQKPWQSDFGEAQKLVEDVLAMLYSKSMGCHVIVLSHMKLIGEVRDDKKNIVDAGKMFPTSVGQAISSLIPRYFNSVLLAESKTFGSKTTKVIRTRSKGNIDLKHSAPGRVPEELPLETGLLDFFRLVQNSGTTK